jgi:hypothetical protein
MRRGGVDSPAWIERGLSAILTPELPIQTFLVGVMTAAAGSRRVTTLAWSEPKIEPTIPYLMDSQSQSIVCSHNPASFGS